MVRIIHDETNPVYLMIDTWKKDNINNPSGYFKKFNNKEEAQEIADINNIDETGFYTNRFEIKRKLN